MAHVVAEPRRSKSRGIGVGLLVSVLVLAAIFGAPPLVRYLKAPAISEAFGLEDAVVALRIEARGVSYLVLVDEAGTTRSARIDERGFEHSRLAWSDAGLSTGDPDNEYLLRHDDLVIMPNAQSPEAPSERTRLTNGTEFVVLTGSPSGQQIAFVDPETEETRVIDVGYVDPELASCGDSVVMVNDSGASEVTPEAGDFNGFGMFDDVEALTCAYEGVYGLGAVAGPRKQTQALRVWSRAGGAPQEFRVRYPQSLMFSVPSSLFEFGGRLYWSADSRLWSVEAPATGVPGSAAAPELDAVEAAYLSGFIDVEDPYSYEAVVGIDTGVLDPVGDRVFSVATDETRITPRKARPYDRLNRLAITSTDVTTGERRIELEVGGIDFPRRDLRVHAIAVDPEWAATR